jgi:NTE family protein
MSEAVVFGGGGVAGIAWITGLLLGLAESGRDATAGDGLIVGTSAGATVAAQIGSGLGLEQLYDRQVVPELQAEEISVEIDLASWMAELAAAAQDAAPGVELRRLVGGVALAAATVPEHERRAVIASRLPSWDWPERILKIVAVDALSGEPRVFDNASGVDLVDAVAASCAVPGIWPAQTIDGRRYVDGGIRGGANVDYAAGAARVLVVAPLGTVELLPTEVPIDKALTDLRADGAEVAVVVPDDGSQQAIGANPLDPSTRAPAAQAGREQGRRLSLDWS